MKRIIFLTALIAVFAVASVAMATAPSTSGTGVNTALYHSYDGLVCADCHTMHYSEDGVAPTDADAGGPHLAALKKPSFTDMCLSCHKEGYNTSATSPLNVADSGWIAPIVMTINGTKPANIAMPGGDFYYADADPAKGHNPAWTGLNQSSLMSVDTVIGASASPAAPGLNIAWTEADWDCHSCHGMHSRFSSSYTAWRQVKRKINGIVHTGNETAGLGIDDGGGKGATATGYKPIESNSRGSITGTSYNATRQDGAALDGADLFAAESNTNRNVYRGGFSSFCSVCHGDFHGGNDELSTGENGGITGGNGNTNSTGKHWLRHPTNVPLLVGNNKYDITKYVKQVTNSKGTAPNPVGYDYKYPLVRVAGTWTPDGSNDTVDPAGTDEVTCVSCHFAHAGPNANMLRWDVASKVAFIADGETDSFGDISDGDNPAYGCNKCHQKGGATAYKKTF